MNIPYTPHTHTHGLRCRSTDRVNGECAGGHKAQFSTGISFYICHICGQAPVLRDETLPFRFVFESSHTRFFEVVDGFTTMGAPVCTVECSAAE